MKPKAKSLLFLSAILNLMLLCYIAKPNRCIIEGYGIVNKFVCKQKTDNLLKQMNKDKFVTYSQIFRKDIKDSLCILVVGNSISLHPKLSAVDWDHLGGMAASEIDSDYVHILMRKISEKQNKKIVLKIINIVSFERGYAQWCIGNFQSFVDFKPDIVIFQIGENVQFSNKNDTALFISKYVSLVKQFPGSKTVITTPFFPSKEKNDLITRVALLTNSSLVDLSHLLLLDDQNYARSEKSFQNDGVGIHPGNYGMRNIANAIYLSLY